MIKDKKNEIACFFTSKQYLKLSTMKLSFYKTLLDVFYILAEEKGTNQPAYIIIYTFLWHLSLQFKNLTIISNQINIFCALNWSWQSVYIKEAGDTNVADKNVHIIRSSSTWKMHKWESWTA